MGPKKGAKSARSTKDDNTVDPWVEELIGKTINDDSWTCDVTIMFESNPSVTFYNKLLAAFCANKTSIFRMKLKILSYTDFKQSLIYDQAAENTDPNKVKPYNKLCSYLYTLMSGNSSDRNQFTSLVASFIKYKILEFKEENIRCVQLMKDFKQREKLDEEEDKKKLEELLAKSNTDKQSKTNNKAAPKMGSQKGKSKTGGDKQIEKLTTLKREQEFLEKVYIEDEPITGPQMYVVLTGFIEPNLPLELLALGVPLVGVLKLETASFTSSDNPDDHTKIIEDLKLDENLYDSNSKPDTKEKSHNMFQDFWRDFYVLLINYKNDDKFENMIFYPFSVILHQENHTGSDIISNLSKQVYDDISQVQYNINGIINERVDYLGSLKKKNVEDTITRADKIDRSEYDRILDSIPPECVDVVHVLEAILIQITKNTTLKERHASGNGYYRKLETKVKSFLKKDDNIHVDNDIHDDDNIHADADIHVVDDIHVDDNIGGLFSKVGSQISKLDDIYDLTPTFKTETLGKVDEKGVVFDYENKLENKMYSHAIDGSNLKDNAIKLLETFCRKRLHTDFSENNYLHFHNSASNMPNNCYERTYFEEVSSDLYKQTGKTINKKVSIIRSSQSESSWYRASLIENNHFLDENLYRKMCLIPCRFQNILLQDKKVNFCFDAPNLYKNDSDCTNCTNVNDEISSKFCYSEICTKVMVQNLFESFENYDCFDFETDNKGQHYVKFHTICCCLEKTLAGSLRTAVCLRDFFDFVHPEITSQFDLEMESLRETLVLENANENSNCIDKITDHWCLDEDFIDADSLKTSQTLRTSKKSFVKNQASEEVAEENVESDNKAEFENSNTLDAFEFKSLKCFNFTEKIKQFRFSKNFATKIRVLCNPFNNDFVSIEPSIDDYTLYFYVGLKQKVNDIKFHIRHKSGMIVYFERVLGVSMKQSGIDEFPIRKSGSILREYQGTTSLAYRQLSYRFSLSWPSCMHLEFVNGSNRCSAYIKQWYSISNKNPELMIEEMRCYTQNGEILKFMKDGSVIVYHSNGRISREAPTRLHSFKMSKTLDKKLSTTNEKIMNDLDGNSETLDDFSQINYKYDQTLNDFTNGTLRSELSNGVVITHSYNGDLIVDFPDGSRTTSTLNCDVVVSVIDDMIVEKYASSVENKFSENSEEFVLISTNYVIEHACFAIVSFSSNEHSMRVGLPLNFSISIDSKTDMFVVHFNDESKMEIARNEINIFNGKSIQSTFLLSNIEEYSRTFPQFERYEFFNCRVDSKSVLVLDSWAEIHNDGDYFCGNYSHELDNIYYMVKKDLSGYKIYPSDFETKLNQLTGKKSVINKYESPEYKSALFVQPLETNEWRMTCDPFHAFERPQSTVDCCRLFWLNPIKIDRKISVTETPLLLAIGFIQWSKGGRNVKKKCSNNKIIYNSILNNDDYRAAKGIYDHGNTIFVSDRLQAIEKANIIVSDNFKKVYLYFKRLERLKKIDRYKKMLRDNNLCKYFNTKVGIGFSIADEVVTNAIKRVEPKEFAKLIGHSIADELIKDAIGIVELQICNDSVEACSSKIVN